MFGLSLGHLLVLLVVVLLFGSRRLPELGASLGKGLRAFKQGMEGEKKTELSDRRNPDDDSSGRGDPRA